GWSGFETNSQGVSFVWAEGQEAALGLYLESPRPLELALELWPFPLAGRHQELTVTLNGSALGHRELVDGQQRVALAVPGERWRAGENLLVFPFAYAVAPADLDPNASDRRRLAAGFDRLSLR